MPARPRVDLAYRQEYAKDIAQDRARVLGLRERVEVAAGPFRHVLLTRETEPIERALRDYKFYAPGVGLALGVEVSGGSDREELVRIRRDWPPAHVPFGDSSRKLEHRGTGDAEAARRHRAS